MTAWQEQSFALAGRVVTDSDLIVGLAMGPEYANQKDLEFKHAALQDFGGFASDEDTPPDWNRVDHEQVVYLPGEFRGQLHIFKLRLALYHEPLDSRFSKISDQDIPGFLADAVKYGLNHMGTYYRY